MFCHAQQRGITGFKQHPLRGTLIREDLSGAAETVSHHSSGAQSSSAGSGATNESPSAAEVLEVCLHHLSYLSDD